MKTISPRLSEKSETFYAQHFRSKTGGAEFILEAWPELYRRTVHGLEGRFELGELCLILDAFGHTSLEPEIVAQYLEMRVFDDMEYGKTDDHWNVDKGSVTKTIDELTLLERACMEIWARAYWLQDPATAIGMREWAERLA